ncbi:MAG: alginate O-acetyltransferase AlgX-related protein [Coprococcus sp.]
MSEQPRLTVDNYGTFAEEYDNYFNDQLPFRNNLIKLNSLIDYFVFDRSANSKVIIGKYNWLFYDNKDDGDPIGCYQGNNLYTEAELQEIAENCVKQRNFLAERNIEFIIFIAPNKERIYSEDMPDRFGTPADNYRVLQIVNYLKENTDLRVVYPYEELMSVKEYLDDNIYYKTDTHWNQIGGYVGAAALLKELGINMPSIEDDRIHITKINNRAGNFASMLHLLKELTFADFDYQVDGYETHNVQNLEEDFNTVFRYVADNADPRKLYVRRDSFSTAMAPYIGSQFNESYFRYSNTYSYEDFAEQHPDVYVYETVERLAYTLKDFSIQ